MTTPSSGDDPEQARSDIDRRFGEIVADYGPTPSVDAQPEPPAAPAQSPAGWRGSATSDGTQLRAPEDVDGQEHFVPEPPDPLPAGDLHFWAIVIGLTLGPLLIFLSATLSAVSGMPFGALGVVLTVAGFVLLVLRSPRGRSGDEGSGARV